MENGKCITYMESFTKKLFKGGDMKTAVIKFSGKALDDFFTNSKWIELIRNLKKTYEGIVLVHGAGNKISEWSYALGIEPRFIEGQRVTDKYTMEVVAAVQSGLLNAKIVSHLQINNFDAVGLSGIDRGLFTAEYVNEKLGFVGSPKISGNSDWIFSLLNEGVIPVFSSLCRDHDGNLMNVNADIFTHALAKVISADTVFFLSDVNGVKLNGVTQSYILDSEINEGIQNGHITGGMIPKLKSCKKLLEDGISKVWIGSELFDINFNDFHNSINLKGTWIVESKAIAV
jgi:acetylglutamate kinase